MSSSSLSKKLSLLACAAVAAVATQSCKKHHDDALSCGDPYLTSVTWVGNGGYGWGSGYIIDPYYGAYAPDGWFDPGDDYEPNEPEPPQGWDSNDGSYFPGADDPSSDIGDPTGGVPSDDGAGDDTGGGIDTGDTTSLHTRHAHVSIQSGGSSTESAATAAEQPDATGCYSCTVGCRIDSGADETGQQAIAGSSYDYASACRSAVHRLERWAHDQHEARVVDCEVLVAVPAGTITDGGTTSDADTRTPAEAGVGTDASSADDASDAGIDAPQ